MELENSEHKENVSLFGWWNRDRASRKPDRLDLSSIVERDRYFLVHCQFFSSNS